MKLLLAVVTLVGAVTFASAATDLSVSNLTTSTQGNFTFLYFDLGFQIDEDQSDYSFDVTVTRERGGTTTTLGFYPNLAVLGSILGRSNCLSCLGATCSGTCRYKHNGVSVNGTCDEDLDAKACTSNSAFKHCICSGSDPKTVFMSSTLFQSGDVITIVVAPAEGVEESSTTNNSVSITF